MEVNVAIGYGGRREIVDAVKSYLSKAATQGKGIDEAIAELDAEEISQYLYTAGQPDPELLIRTSGEQRLGDSCYGRALTQSFISVRHIGQIFVGLISFEHFAHIHNAIAGWVSSGVSLKEMASQF